MRSAPLRRLGRDRRGAVLIEFAFAVPILAVILLGCYEAARYVFIHQKLDRIATSMADLVTRSEGITAAQLDDLFGAAQRIAAPYDLAADGRIVVSSVYRPSSGNARVAWQRASAGSLPVTSRVGVEDGVATMPPGLVVRTGENVIVAEVWFRYRPLFAGVLFEGAELYHTAFNRPRVIDLTVCSGC